MGWTMGWTMEWTDGMDYRIWTDGMEYQLTKTAKLTSWPW